MSVEQNIATIKKFVAVGLNEKKIDSIMSEICAPDVVLEAPGVPTAAGQASGFAIFREAVFGWTDAFPDVQVDIASLIVEGNSGSFDLPYSGTHAKEFAGVPPTNEKVHGAELWFVQFDDEGRFKNVRICEYGTPLRAALIAAQAHGVHP
ncbi:MAG: ester cyclase [Capsulimonadales bacterium]|nr:ester cyclase [Capsulimonadales bacterium]